MRRIIACAFTTISPPASTSLAVSSLLTTATTRATTRAAMRHASSLSVGSAGHGEAAAATARPMLLKQRRRRNPRSSGPPIIRVLEYDSGGRALELDVDATVRRFITRFALHASREPRALRFDGRFAKGAPPLTPIDWSVIGEDGRVIPQRMDSGGDDDTTASVPPSLAPPSPLSSPASLLLPPPPPSSPPCMPYDHPNIWRTFRKHAPMSRALIEARLWYRWGLLSRAQQAKWCRQMTTSRMFTFFELAAVEPSPMDGPLFEEDERDNEPLRVAARQAKAEARAQRDERAAAAAAAVRACVLSAHANDADDGASADGGIHGSSSSGGGAYLPRWVDPELAKQGVFYRARRAPSRAAKGTTDYTPFLASLPPRRSGGGGAEQEGQSSSSTVSSSQSGLGNAAEGDVPPILRAAVDAFWADDSVIVRNDGGDAASAGLRLPPVERRAPKATNWRQQIAKVDAADGLPRVHPRGRGVRRTSSPFPSPPEGLVKDDAPAIPTTRHASSPPVAQHQPVVPPPTLPTQPSAASVRRLVMGDALYEASLRREEARRLRQDRLERMARSRQEGRRGEQNGTVAIPKGTETTTVTASEAGGDSSSGSSNVGRMAKVLHHLDPYSLMTALEADGRSIHLFNQRLRALDQCLANQRISDLSEQSAAARRLDGVGGRRARHAEELAAARAATASAFPLVGPGDD